PGPRGADRGRGACHRSLHQFPQLLALLPRPRGTGRHALVRRCHDNPSPVAEHPGASLRTRRQALSRASPPGLRWRFVLASSSVRVRRAGPFDCQKCARAVTLDVLWTVARKRRKPPAAGGAAARENGLPCACEFYTRTPTPEPGHPPKLQGVTGRFLTPFPLEGEGFSGGHKRGLSTGRKVSAAGQYPRFARPTRVEVGGLHACRAPST